MNEYLTKADLTAAINQHELDAAKRQKDISEKEQRLRHDQWSRFQREIISMDDKQTKIYDKVESNDFIPAVIVGGVADVILSPSTGWVIPESYSS